MSVSDFSDFEGDEYALGLKVVEMAERLKTAHAVVPGSVATYAFEMDGIEFGIEMTVKGAKAKC